MSKGKGKEVATEPDWKEKLAKLDQEFGWDEEAGPDWADDCDAEKQESTNENQLVSATAKMAITSSSITNHTLGPSSETENHTDNGSNNTFHPPPDTFEDDEIMSTEMQRHIWDAAVEESKSSGNNHATLARHDDQEQVDAAQQQQTEDDENWETTEEEDEEEEIRPKSKLAAYIYHRFGTGPKIRYENRCSCCESLFDDREEKRKREREYYAQKGVSCLIKDPCVLLPYKQEDMPGTGNVDKPVLMVTTPEGETLYPHDMEEYPELPTTSRDETRIEMGQRSAVPNQSEYLVPYEEEDGADI